MITAVLDSGTTSHMLNDIAMFKSVQKSDCKVELADGRIETVVKATGVAVGRLHDSSDNSLRLSMASAKFTPTYPVSLLSVDCLMEAGIEAYFQKKGGGPQLRFPDGRVVKIKKVDRLW